MHASRFEFEGSPGEIEAAVALARDESDIEPARGLGRSMTRLTE